MIASGKRRRNMRRSAVRFIEMFRDIFLSGGDDELGID